MEKFKKIQNLLLNNRFVFLDKPGEKPSSTPVQAEKPKEKEVAPKGPSERADLADKEAKKTSEKPETKETPAGKVHQTYFEKTEAIKEEDAEKDREKLRSEEIKNIRFNSRLLKPKAAKEDEETQASSIKEETQKRIKAYTEKADKDWYTLNYKRLGSDKKGRTHEINVGLGDILLDPDIKEILVKKANGEVIKAHRGVVPTRQNHVGRQAFLDENNSYVDTYTGDSFRILSDQETNLKDPTARKKYLNEFSTEEKTREEDSKHYEEEMKAQDDQDSYYLEAKLDPSKSVVDQIKLRLSSSQKEMAGIIEREFTTALKAKGLSAEATARVVAAAIVNAYKESGLRADAGPKTDEQAARRENSVGLFQLYIKGVGHGMSIAERQDPVINCKTMLARKVLANDGKTLLARAQAGASVSELTAIFCRDLEVPANRFVVMQARAKVALKMFGERVVSDENEIAESIDDGKKGFNGKGIIKLKSNQDTWIFGSSGAVAMNNLKNSLSLGNTGFFGVVGISPGKFYEKLQSNWPRISKLKLPKQVVLVGLAANGLGSNSDAAVQKNLDTYNSIKKFLEEKGIKVKIATVQPAAGMGEQINRFNNELRKKYGPEAIIDIAKYTTTEDGKHINAEYAAADGIHLSSKGYQQMAKLIKEGADKEKTA